MKTQQQFRPVVVARLLAILGTIVVVGMMYLPSLIVEYQYSVLSPGDSVRHSRYAGTVEKIDHQHEAVIRTFDDRLVRVPVEELIER